MVGPGDIVVDCTGCKSLLRDHLAPHAGAAVEGANTVSIQLEHAIVATFLFGGPYVCNELCKYYKNVENLAYKFIPAVGRTYYDGDVSHVTGIVGISDEEYAEMPARFDGALLRSQYPHVAASMDRFIDKVKQEAQGDVIGETRHHPDTADPLPRPQRHQPQVARHGRTTRSQRRRCFCVGDSAIGSPYFQSISLGFECAMFLAGLLAQRDLPLRDVFDRYELQNYKQWLRVYMRSKMIKHNKDLFETVDDKLGLLGKLHIY